jgi:hypothetical protein
MEERLDTVSCFVRGVRYYVMDESWKNELNWVNTRIEHALQHTTTLTLWEIVQGLHDVYHHPVVDHPISDQMGVSQSCDTENISTTSEPSTNNLVVVFQHQTENTIQSQKKDLKRLYKKRIYSQRLSHSLTLTEHHQYHIYENDEDEEDFRENETKKQKKTFSSSSSFVHATVPRLPPEMWSIIGQFLFPGSDIMPLRLVSREMNNTVCQQMLSTHYLDFSNTRMFQHHVDHMMRLFDQKSNTQLLASRERTIVHDLQYRTPAIRIFDQKSNTQHHPQLVLKGAVFYKSDAFDEYGLDDMDTDSEVGEFFQADVRYMQDCEATFGNNKPWQSIIFRAPNSPANYWDVSDMAFHIPDMNVLKTFKEIVLCYNTVNALTPLIHSACEKLYVFELQSKTIKTAIVPRNSISVVYEKCHSIREISGVQRAHHLQCISLIGQTSIRYLDSLMNVPIIILHGCRSVYSFDWLESSTKTWYLDLSSSCVQETDLSRMSHIPIVQLVNCPQIRRHVVMNAFHTSSIRQVQWNPGFLPASRYKQPSVRTCALRNVPEEFALTAEMHMDKKNLSWMREKNARIVCVDEISQ